MKTEIAIYDYIQKAEYLRTKGFNFPQSLPPLKIDAFCEIHKDIDNKKSIEDMEKQFSVLALFKIKTGYKKYKDLILKLMDNAI